MNIRISFCSSNRDTTRAFCPKPYKASCSIVSLGYTQLARHDSTANRVSSLPLELPKATQHQEISANQRSQTSPGSRPHIWSGLRGQQDKRQQESAVQEFATRRNGKYSKDLLIEQGLPQGSPLSPILFAILISELGRKWPKQIKIYADDIQILIREKIVKRKLRSDGSEETHRTTEELGNEVATWLKSKGLRTDPGKSEFLFLHKRQEDASPIDVEVDGQRITSKAQVKYLGIIFDRYYLSPNRSRTGRSKPSKQPQGYNDSAGH